MNNKIVGDVLRKQRNKRGLTLEKLAEKAELDLTTINRIETGKLKRSPRKDTLEKIAKALGIDSNILTGVAPAPENEDSTLFPKQQANFRISSSARNALALVGMRYKIAPTTIIEMAALTFHVLAEGSLKVRSDRIGDVEGKYSEFENQASNISHLPSEAFYRRIPGLEIENASIRARDIFGMNIDLALDAEGLVNDCFDDDSENPFVEFLKELVDNWNIDADINSSAHWGDYTICKNEALELTGGDRDAAGYILDGSAKVTELPKELRRWDGDPDARANWIKVRGQQWQAEYGLDLDIPDQAIKSREDDNV